MYLLVSAIPWRQLCVILCVAVERISASTSASSGSTIFTNSSTSSSLITTKSSLLTLTTTSVLDTQTSTTSPAQSKSSVPKPVLLDADSSTTSSPSSSVSDSGTSTVNDTAVSDSSTGAPDSATSAHHASALGSSTSMTSHSTATNSSILAPSTNLLLDISTSSTSASYSTKSVHEAPGNGALTSVNYTTMYANSSISVQASTASSSTTWTNASCTITAPHYKPTTCDPYYDAWTDISNFNITLQHMWFCSATGQDSVISIYNDMQASLGLLNVQLNQIGAVDTVSATETNSDLTYSRYSSLFTSREKIISTLWGTNGDAVYTLGDAVSDSCQFTVCSWQLQSQRSQWYAGNTDIFVYSAKKPCCGYCTVGGAAVQVAYWPTPAPTPPVTVLVDSNNDTYYSPYVYATFIDFSSYDDCGAAPVYYPAITGTFADGYLMTSQYPSDASQQLTASFEDWTTIDFRDFGPQCVCTPPHCASDPVLGWQTNLCTPELSIPTDLLEFIPAWRTCTAQFDGVFDPPIALQTVGGLFTTPSTPQAQSTPTPNPAAPGNIPTTPGPTPTPAPTPPVSPPPTPQPEKQSSSSPSPVFNGNSSPNTNTPTSTSSINGLPSIFIPSTTRQGGLTLTMNGHITTTSNAQNFPINSPNASPSPTPIPIPEVQTLTTNPQGNVVIGTQTASLNTDGNLVLGTQTITPDANGDFVVTGVQTITPIPIPEVQTLTTNPQGAVVIGTQTASLNTDGNLVIGTQIITPDAKGDFVVTGVQTITESGGQIVTITGETLSVETATVGSTKAIGAIIASFMGAATPTTTPSASLTGAPAQYTGAAMRFEGLSEGRLLVGGVLVLMIWL